MKRTHSMVSLLLAVVMAISLCIPAMATSSTPTREEKTVGIVSLHTVNGPYRAPYVSRGTYHYHAREERNTYNFTAPFDCSTGVGKKLDISVDNSIGNVPLNVYIYYNGTLVEQYLMYAGETETTYIESTDGSALTKSGKVVVKPANGGDSVYWLTVYQHN